jgi:hypothetical protein
MNKSHSKIRHIQESNIMLENRILNERISNTLDNNLLTEQVTLLTINPQSILFSSGDTSKQIKLKGVDPKTKRPLVLKYDIKGEYSSFNFDVYLREIKRLSNGNLYAEAQPSNRMAAWTLKKLVPKENQSEDGWLYVNVPSQKINDAINQLITNKGSTAKIDAGQGIKITLTLLQ